MKYAGFWKRVVASIIDSVILIPASFLVGALQAFGGAYVEGFIVGIVLSWLYFAISESQSWQATLGKKLMGIKVTDLHGQQISFARASGRYVSKFLSYITLGLGYVMVAFTKRKQGLHDLVAETLVIESAQNFSRDDFNAPNVSSKTVVVSKQVSDFESNSSNKIILAGFNSTGHVIRLNFDVSDPKLISQGLIIGRDANRADLYISDASISRVHAKIYKKDGDLWIEDMGSTNGMIVNGRKVQPGNSAFLSISGTVTIGGIDLTLGRG
jgi:uncharacterized RDD family membrane protein YckC